MEIRTERRMAKVQTWRRLKDRTAMEALFEYASYIAPEEQQFLSSCLESNYSQYKLARIHKTTRSSLRRRIRALVSRLSDPMFRLVVRYGKLLPTSLAAVAKARYVEGYAWSRIMKDHSLTRQQVRYRLEQARVMLVQLTLQELGQGDIAQMLA
jgi:hypothetical protein